jgi:hypothetical protein
MAVRAFKESKFTTGGMVWQASLTRDDVGCPATESLKGVTKKEREQQGKMGGVVRIAYLSAVVPRLGNSSSQTLGELAGALPSMGEVKTIPFRLLDECLGLTIEQDGWMFHSDLASIAALCCSDLPLEAAIAEVAKMGKHFGACFLDPITHAGYKDVPVSWFFAGKDLVVTPQVQQVGIETIEESWVGTEREGKKVDVTRVECDHFPFIRDDIREKTVSWIEGLIEKGGSE